MKKIKISIMTILVAISTIIGTQTVQAASSEPIEIRTVEDLMAISNDPSASYILMNDIDLSETKKGGSLDTGHGWTPIDYFTGVLDGNGYRIKNLNMYGSELENYQFIGFINTCEDGTIKNIGFTDVDIDITNSKYTQFGTICGWSYGYSAKIENCYVTGNINISIEQYGGLIGGCCAINQGNYIDNCFNAADIKVKGDNGNLRLYVYGVAEHSEKSYNVGNINTSGFDGNIYIYGASKDDDNNYYLNSAIENITAEVNNGTKLTSAMMKMQGSFTGFDFANTWEIDPYCSYKYPQLKNNRIVRLTSLDLTAPSKLVYDQGDELDLSDAKVKLNYEDDVNSTIPLTKGMLSGYDMSKIGKQTVNVTYGGISKTFDIEVKEIPVESVSIISNLSIYRPESKQITATILPERASDKKLAWTSSDTSIATVSDGLVRAKNPGTVTITATSVNGKIAECQVTVMVAATSILLDKTEATLEVGGTDVIKANVLPLECTDEVKWKSDNDNVVQVSNGKIIAVAGGTTTITAYTDSGIEAKCKVTVEIPVTSISVQETLNIYSAKSETLTVTFTPENASNRQLTWNSADPNIASVSEDGAVRGKSAGTTTITATSVNGKTASCKVTVLVACVSLSLDKSSYELQVGNIGKITVTAEPANSADVIKWKTSDANVVDVDNGEVYAIGEGKATITAYTDNGVEAQCVVTVTNAAKVIKQVKDVSVKLKTVKNVKGKKLKLTLTGKSICDGYEIQYASKKNFSGKKTIKKTSGSATINKLKKGKQYYVRARGYKTIQGKVYYGKWSSVKKVKIKK